MAVIEISENEVIAVRLKLIACKVLFRELSYLSSLSENIVDITWIRQGCHDYPDQLRQVLQNEIDLIEEGQDVHTNKQVEMGGASGIHEDFDAILIGYGLCSNATAGITAKKHRLVIPRAHDCITLFLGSKERYAEYFKSIPGCFWYTASWIENTDMPGRERMERTVAVYKEKGYDDETISYLLTELGGLNNYHNAGYIRMPFVDKDKYRQITKDAADYFQWQYHEMEGSLDLMKRFVSGDWNEEDFLILEPGQTAAASYDSGIMKAAE